MKEPAIDPMSRPRIPRRLVTAHQKDGTACVARDDEVQFQEKVKNEMYFAIGWTTAEAPVDLSSQMQGDTRNVNLTLPGGSVMRFVDWAPGTDCAMHRTISLDYGIVLEGEMKLILDNGETKIMKRGDICVQVGTMHAWANNLSDQWSRMGFILLDAKKLSVGGQDLTDTKSYGMDSHE